MTDHILQTMDGAVLVITLNKPAKLNAWDKPMRDDLVTAILRGSRDPQVEAIVLTGAGDRAFCAGQDLNEGKSFDADRAELWIEEWRTLYNVIRRCEKPFVAALNGIAAGSAFQVSLLADFRIGHAGSRMGQPEINQGIASATGFWILREMLGLARAIDLVQTGRILEAEECHRLGLINEMVPQPEVLSRAVAFAQELAAKPKQAYAFNKQRICAATQTSFDETFELARQIHRKAFELGDTQAQMAKFLTRK
ncbi:enoyl-CoA hydratase/isomerase family protein [Falsirhodobacter halotolerans]|uniref:enoyl-CoA hydratase/isomerase family protein n=1 Tax=Falsirhodobacter halotolerans TaxID=1146892 RepID=UPI001FD520BA|nr:enoyl-CoA hydratase/isomerase family protein [Falsirhodobacter halotolerans]MCJ8141015.1 enoyl-CoA hydratase/isomerase family protein [Falsirhodobacter halotolerans]